MKSLAVDVEGASYATGRIEGVADLVYTTMGAVVEEKTGSVSATNIAPGRPTVPQWGGVEPHLGPRLRD